VYADLGQKSREVFGAWVVFMQIFFRALDYILMFQQQ